jgi:hypothetical protein
MNLLTGRAVAFGVGLTAMSLLYGQTSTSSSAPEPEPPPSSWRRLAVGFRVNGLPFNVMHNHDVSVATTDSLANSTYSTSNTYLQLAFGPSLEFFRARKTHVIRRSPLPSRELYQDR